MPHSLHVPGDAASGEGLAEALEGIDVAYFLIHSMEPATGNGSFGAREQAAAENFAAAARAAGVRRISVGSALSRAALGAFLRAAREIADKGTFTFGEQAASFAELNKFMISE